MPLYDKTFVEVSGKLLGENMSVDIELQDGTTVVNTIAKGFSGISPGAMVMTVKLKDAIPVTGAEVDFQRLYVTHEAFSMRLTLGGSGKSTMLPECYVIGPYTLSSDVTKPTEEDITIVGAGLPFE